MIYRGARLGDKVGAAPRLFLKRLIADVLDRVDQFADIDPRRDYAPTDGAAELADSERETTHLGDLSDVGRRSSVDQTDLDPP